MTRRGGGVLIYLPCFIHQYNDCSYLPSGATEFRCPEEFGYYQHPTECSLYYVCVFGGPLLESCTGGLVYSHDLQTCDWPRNVACKTQTPEPPTDNQINTDTLEDLEAPLSLHSKKVSPGRLVFGFMA